MKKIILIFCLLIFQCTNKSPNNSNISEEGSIEGVIHTDVTINLSDIPIQLIPENPQLNTIIIFPDTTGYFKQNIILNGNYQLLINFYSFNKYIENFTINGNSVNFNITLTKESFYLNMTGGGCEYFSWYEQGIFWGDMGKRIVIIESNYKGKINDAISTILDTIALNCPSYGGRFKNNVIRHV